MLQVWLPLNKEGDFQNKGLADITVTNNGATYNTNGKIGGCYVVNSNKLTFPSLSFMEMKHGNSFSLFNWVKGTTKGLLYACNAFEVRFRPDYIVICNGPNSSNYFAKYDAAFDTNIWYHLGFTWDGSEDILRLYLNGVQVAQDKKSTITSYTINSTFNISYDGPRYINDFRIYDHCLSPKEVKEISKGLVLHYPLNSIISNTIYDCSGYCNNGTITGNLTTSDNTPRYDKCTVFNTNQTITINDTNTYITDQITVSFWIKCNQEFNSNQFNIGSFRGGIFIRKDTSSYYHLTFWWNGYTDSGEAQGGGRAVVKSIQLNHWYFVTYVFNKGKFTIYLDGVSTRTEDRSTKYTKIKINASKNIGNFDGCMSDFRIYSTALSDEDIKELYNTSVLIDNQQNISAYSFNETSENNISKSGILNSNQFIEDSNAEIYEDKTKANQIIEI